MSELEERDIKVVKTYVDALLPLIAEGRHKVMAAGTWPRVIYIGDIFPREGEELRPSAMKVDTGCEVFGMKIIADYRVPFDKFYIMQGEL